MRAVSFAAAGICNLIESNHTASIADFSRCVKAPLVGPDPDLPPRKAAPSPPSSGPLHAFRDCAFNFCGENRQVISQLRKKLSFLRVGRQVTDEGALGGICAELFQLSLHVFHCSYSVP
ncbi:hypothetical protein ABIF50_005685 [Bradyrhizobium diazoefficiens]|uniref:Uncharacterized protein n=1 Tax=Bradyrhizobium diazoefficiens SEMIA 5080 TaxID=754504 RepID=A0A837CN56_9BRAD|nr:hypothetical protein BJA5080_06619 [Bradyrhizobium diazoefficiens SEMIA 5080]